MITMISAMAANRVIGKDNGLPRDYPEDMARFRALTVGKPIVMWRKTFDSMGRALPKRRNIVESFMICCRRGWGIFYNWWNPGCDQRWTRSHDHRRADYLRAVYTVCRSYRTHYSSQSIWWRYIFPSFEDQFHEVARHKRMTRFCYLRKNIYNERFVFWEKYICSFHCLYRSIYFITILLLCLLSSEWVDGAGKKHKHDSWLTSSETCEKL